MKKTAFQTSTLLFCLIAFAFGVKGQSLPTVASGTLGLWLKADAGVITNAGGFVSQWQDQSAQANHASQGVANHQPQLMPNALNGRPVVRFDGIQDASLGDYLQGGGDVGIGGAFTSFLVYKVVNTAPDEEMALLVGTPGSTSSTRSFYIYLKQMGFSAWGHDYVTSFQIPTNTYRIWTLRMSSGDTLLNFFDTDNVSNFTTSVSAAGLITPGTGYYIGGLGSQTRNLNGDVAEVVVYQGSITDGDRLAVEDYLKAKYFSTPPLIVTQPQSQDVAVGSNAVFSVGASGVSPFQFQWIHNETNIVDATNSTLTVSNAQPENAGNYYVVVTNTYGATTSDVVVLTVVVPVNLTVQPQSQDAVVGSNVTFSASATGDSPQFQWRWNDAAIAGATNTSLILTNVQITNAGNYAVFVTNSVSSVLSSNAILTVNDIPVINSHPSGATVLAGETVSLSVSVQGAFPEVNSGALRLWLKADTGVVQNGGQISQWIDQSPFGNSCLQANTNKQPAFVAAAWNGRPVVRFDGIQSTTTGDYLQSTNNLNIPGAFTAFLAYNVMDTTPVEEFPLMVGTPGLDSSTRTFYIYLKNLGFSAWRNDYVTGFQIPTNTYRIWTMRLNAAKTSLGLFDTDGVSNFAASFGTGGLDTPAAGYYLGGLGSQTRNFKGDIAEIMVYDAALTEGERVAVENYLRDRYYGGAGGGAFQLQWQVNGTNVLGATNATLTLTNLQPNQSGDYTVTVSNLVGSVTSHVATVRARYVFPMVGGQRLTNSAYTYIGSATVSFESYFAGGPIFYTLDGSTPTYLSEYYTVPITVSNNAVLRALAYSFDFTQAGFSDPVTFNIIPLYALTTSTAGGGKIAVNPTTGPYVSGSNVTVSATASNGWTFLGWLGDLSGTNLTNTVTMTRNKAVEAVFGTALHATTPGGGEIALAPALPLYSYGTAVRLTAIPQAGNSFNVWINAASGNVNPLDFTITNTNATVSALFSPLGASQYSLTLLTTGGGQVFASPSSNSYTSGQAVTLTATPDAGESFTGWSGDAGGTENPLSVNLTASRTITANFTSGLRLIPSASGDGFRIRMTNLLAGQYAIEISTNLVEWNPLVALTNIFGTLEYTDPAATNSEHGFYRGIEIHP